MRHSIWRHANWLSTTIWGSLAGFYMVLDRPYAPFVAMIFSALLSVIFEILHDISNGRQPHE